MAKARGAAMIEAARAAAVIRKRDVSLASLHAMARELSRKYASGVSKAHSPYVSLFGRHRLVPDSSTGRQINVAAALLSLSVLGDSGIEHYRGSFQNRAMYVPLGVSALALAASLFGAVDPRAKSHVARDTVYGLAALTGIIGLGFHGYNILKRPGGVSWLNLFYAAPIGAPIALLLAGALGRGAEKVRDARPSKVLGRPAGQALGVLSSIGLAGTVAEAGLLHFRGAFQNPGMFLPVTLPPVAATLLAASIFNAKTLLRRAAKACLWLTAVLGFGGVGFHAYGVSRNMGGWRNWSQNILNGPPLPAPPSFTGLALSGLAALSLVENSKAHSQ